MALHRFWLQCAGALLLTVPGWQGLCAEDRSREATPDEAVIADGSPSPAAVIFEETIDAGFVFLDAEYLSPPYLVQATVDSVTVNGRSWPTGNARGEFGPRIDADDSAGPSQHWHRRWRGEAAGFMGGGRNGWNGGPRASRWVARHLADDLAANTIIVARSGRRPEAIYTLSQQHDFFLVLLSGDSSPEEAQALLAAAQVEPDRWGDSVSGITLTDELRARARQVIDEVGATTEQNFAEIRAHQRLNTWAYPLTVLGMILGVAALGHLLKSFSRLEGGEDNLLPPEVLRATSISIGLMVALSLFDLTWTILASQAGQMRELNPLGSRLIDDPTLLIAFKFIATLVGCGLLFALRHHRRARLACWWMCLVCTVLTFRWVMFNSMFVA